MSHLPRSRRVMMLVGVVVVLSTLVATYKSPAERAQLATLEGIDADNNGIRDDVDALIADNKDYQQSPKQRLYAIKLTRQLQLELAISKPDKKFATESSQTVNRYIGCFMVSTAEAKAPKTAENFINAIINTPERGSKERCLELLVGSQTFLAMREEECG